jgi:putative transposase
VGHASACPLRHSGRTFSAASFVRNHATLIVACDFFAVVTATFRTLNVFVIMDVATRRILHHNVTPHPTPEWTLQQFWEALPDDHSYQYPDP